MRVLKVLSRNAVVDEISNTLILDGGKVVLPIIKNSLGVFVEENEENSHLLYSNKEGYIPGYLETKDGVPLFSRSEPRSFVQVFVDCDLDLGIEPPFKMREEGKNLIFERVDTVCMLIEKRFSFIETRICAVPLKMNNPNVVTFELFQYRPGFVRGMKILHRKYGEVKIVLRAYGESFKVFLEQKYRMIETIDTLDRKQDNLSSNID